MGNYQWNGIVLNEWKMLQDKLDEKFNAWETFIKTGNVTANCTIAPEILSSWKRCRDIGINPYDDSIEVLSKQQLYQRRRDNKRLIDIVRPILQETAGSIKDSGYRIDLYDKDLYLIERFGKRLIEGDEERREVVLGQSHKEKDVGTNSTNLAALLGKPVTLMAYEHYRTTLHELTCVSVPIEDRNNDIMAVLTVEGYIWPMHKHTEALLVALKYCIEDRLYAGVDSCGKIMKAFNSELVEMMDVAIVAADRVGKIIFANSKAYNTILAGWNNAIGFSCENIWGVRNPVQDVIKEKKPIVNRLLIFNDNKYYTNSMPILESNGDLLGIIISTQKPREKANRKEVPYGSRAHHSFENIAGSSDEIKQAVRLAKETAKMDNNILISGESGTGKELFAEAIHNESNYCNGPFIPVNCAAIPNTLLESELFGYEDGAFTGARKGGSIGKFEAAVGGTIFLDEINSMSLEMQAKLLRVIQNKTVTHVGGNEEIPVNVRIIAATNIDLWQMVKEEKFREDLYYRINVICISVPPLRERQGDTEVLIYDILSQISSRLNQQLLIDRGAVELLKRYSWPGNVRELENVLERSWVIARTDGADRITEGAVLSYQGIEEELNNDSITVEQKEENTKSSIDDIEKVLIKDTLEKNKGNIQATARELGIARNTLYRKIKKYGIEYKKNRTGDINNS